jgi:hypothetical protein
VSRRHHGRPHHRARATEAERRGPESERRVTGAGHGTVADAAPSVIEGSDHPSSPAPATTRADHEPDLRSTVAAAVPAVVVPRPAARDTVHAQVAPHPQNGAHPNPQNGVHHQNGNERNGQCTAPQLRRFIKSRPYVPMHELRRRFGIDGADDDVTGVRLEPGWVYLGLPTREGGLLGELLRTGEIGYELSLDPRTPIVIGVYPMRPVPRS